MKRIVIAGTSSMVGKTTISTGIMKALSKKHNVQPYKIGPDYIDPTYHTEATKNKSRNLDSFFMDEMQVRSIFKRHSKNKDINVIEGVRGLYEGISPYNDIGSTASVAKTINAPVILLMDARSLTRSAAAIIKGFKSFDPDLNIKGVIFNKIRGEGHLNKLKEAVKYYDNEIEIIGAIPRDDGLSVSQRHLGLVPTPENKRELLERIDLWGETVEKCLDLEKIVELSDENFDFCVDDKNKEETLWKVEKNNSKIAVALDESFNFYYWDNFDALEENGAKLKFFSPINDSEVPDCDTIYLGGGYPEIFSEKLSNNKSMIESIRNFDGKIYGECGGLMYLTNSIDGIEMLKLIDADAVMTPNVQGLSYVKGTFEKDCIIGKKSKEFKAHEFHYSKLININENDFSYKINRGKGIINSMDGITSKDGDIVGGYAHQHCIGNPYFAASLSKM
ncbi:cobyrinic acid a,c-diamide synthase [Methanococcus maripaludis]|uniref:Cobyrinate a,c-diamide synthase n=1 Tax=Methanococcus maripaludis TaxID=39152 RepID=A0A7J9S609_METMI|nr:Ni-sirohydrochlorin a,c-diamide synthase [Methanococcus maripaludis]MBB6401333.1 cobyrinic acid a,c-diamide synthase [Methanococcus maripaludis]